jgi:hypothetical protein
LERIENGSMGDRAKRKDNPQRFEAIDFAPQKIIARCDLDAERPIFWRDAPNRIGDAAVDQSQVVAAFRVITAA